MISPDELDAMSLAEQAAYGRGVRAGERRLELVGGTDSEPPPYEFPPEAGQATGTQPLPGFRAAEVWEGYEAPPYLVKQLLGPGEVTVLFGASGHFKSVIAVDLALCVGTGTEFHGVRARRAGVLYVAGEGHIGIRKRMRAWMMEKGMDATSEQPALYVTSVAANLMGAPEVLRVTAEAARDALNATIELVIIDTLAANFGPGDENHASEMQLAISAARSAAPQASVLLVHHIGHGQDERERGSYALIAAADYRVKASYDDGPKSIEMEWLKVKDDERPAPMAFAWKAVPLGWEDGDGEELTSVVLERLPQGHEGVQRHPSAAGLGGNQGKAMRALRLMLAKTRKNLTERGDDPSQASILTAGWRAHLEEKGMNRFRFREVLTTLQEKGLIRIDGPHVYPVEAD